IPLRALHAAGLFSAFVPSLEPDEERPAYRLLVQRAGGELATVDDPYAFPPVLSDFDLHLIGEGKHLDLYERLGAHPMRLRGVDGVAFAVWAPNARRVSVVGDFNGWDERTHPMRLRAPGIWEVFIPGIAVGALYKYALLSWSHDYRVLKADPFAFEAEVRPGTASRVCELAGYAWGDGEWMMHERPGRNALDAPISVYEVHAGSWRSPSNGGGGEVSYRDLAHQLVPYVKGLGYTHIELMPVAEHPFDGSWGYQVTGYYAPTSRYGTPHDFMYFVDYCHQHGIGVLMDWVPAHFPRDEHGLAYFDGSHLYEHADPRQGAQPDWGTLVFNFGRNEVRGFFIANALFWFEKYHMDGLRVDAVASLLYLDYSRKEGEWVPNRYGGRENLEAIAFVRECNTRVLERFPDVLMIAEESTAWPGVTHPVAEGGLGFSLKWNMGWMHDILEYTKLDPVHRAHHQQTLTFSLVYAWSERFILPFSHDEVVHVKGSMLNKMPGDHWQKFANLRALYAYMYGHPGKKLLFMGGEFAQWAEWNFAGYLDWALVEGPHVATTLHGQVRDLVRDLNALLRSYAALHARDFTPEGFEWIDGSDTAHSVISFVRYAPGRTDPLVFICNFTPVPRYAYRLGVPVAADYEEVLNTDALVYGGSNIGNLGRVAREPVMSHGWEHSLALTLPPLATLVLRPMPLGAHKRTAKGGLPGDKLVRFQRARREGDAP
ncbi:MAG: 1,4-alpha-glucan branching protein GlgB, partial [Ktedonobacterales bacterium]|nr:1,4-alpha-glucan branching protein GlgB [Ktedonobacterales bacterium]